MSNSNLKTRYVLLIFIIFSLIINLFILNTVHKRDANIVFSKSLPGVTMSIQNWIETGFTNKLGFFSYDKEGESIHTSYNSGWAHLNYFVQYFNGKLKNTNDIDHNLNSRQNLIYSVITSVILAIFCYNIFSFYNFTNFSAIFLALSAQSMYLTFPVHLVQYFELYPATQFLIFFSIFLYLIFKSIIQKKNCSYLTLTLAFLTGFACAYVDWFIALFSVIWIFSLIIFLDQKLLSNSLFKLYGFGVFTFLIYFIGLLLILKFSLGYNITKDSSSFIFRSGLDGDLRYYATHIDLLHSKFRKMNRSYQWYLYMALAISCLFLFFKDYLLNKLTNEEKILFIIPLGLFFPYFIIFPQSTIIHPYYTDPYLFYFLFFITSIFFPIYLKKKNFNQKNLLFVFLIISFIFSFYHLRLFSVGFPKQFIFGISGLT